MVKQKLTPELVAELLLVERPAGTRITKRGLRALLVELAYTRDPAMNERTHGHYAIDPTSRYLADRFASRIAREVFHIRIPARYSQRDRAHAAWMLQRYNYQVAPAVRAWANKEV